MANSPFKKATKEQTKLRCALFGPSGAGKTFSALRMATGIGGPIAFIDTERKSASKYADRFDFDVVDLERRNIESYIEMIQMAGSAGYNVLIIDSLSHAWQELLEEVEKLAQAKYKGNTWSAWSEGTPRQRKLIDAILNFPGHIIATSRSKTEWTNEKDPNTGKNKPVRVGLAPEQGKGIEYEFDLLMEINTEHFATVLKDRTGKYQDQFIEKPDEKFGHELAEWLASGIAPQPWEEPVKRAPAVEKISEKQATNLVGIAEKKGWYAGSPISWGAFAVLLERKNIERPETMKKMTDWAQNIHADQYNGFLVMLDQDVLLKECQAEAYTRWQQKQQSADPKPAPMVTPAPYISNAEIKKFNDLLKKHGWTGEEMVQLLQRFSIIPAERKFIPKEQFDMLCEWIAEYHDVIKEELSLQNQPNLENTPR